MSVNVLFVCLGNICRSPTAHGLFQSEVEKGGKQALIHVDSAGTGDWHIGHAPDTRAQATAIDRGYDISHLRARQVSPGDFAKFDYILGMDRENLTNLQKMSPPDYSGVLGLFLEVSGVGEGLEVPDPYYGDQAQFDHAIQLIETGAAGLLQRIQDEHGI